ncbi:Jag N-terminal domain-containing protein [Nitrosophilus labii]|uniref:Jag N-terminal domain-containing protein n=1 Tax=Nitrosophilus labii TaxID=2706014 RepID=UPI0016573BBA|nr:Jag N-terminal domain-containing protein [Nitrosophilus labii]
MSKKIEAPTLEEAYKLASKELNCSITDLEIEIVQNPSKGFLGIGKKNAIIIATCKKKEQNDIKRELEKKEDEVVEKTQETKPQKVEETIKIEKKEIIKPEEKPKAEVKQTIVKEEKEKEPKETQKLEKRFELPQVKDEFQDFYKESVSIEEIAQTIENDINDLFKYSCFDIEKIKVKPYDENTVLIEFSGADSALLIGKEGYRYKALSYMLFNWVNSKYDLQIRLEIAEFLKTQEEMVKNYLKPVIEKIKKEGRGQTKPLDGVLIQIALKELRAEFRDKYVAIRTNRQGEKYIIVNQFNKKNEQ